MHCEIQYRNPMTSEVVFCSSACTLRINWIFLTGGISTIFPMPMLLQSVPWTQMLEMENSALRSPRSCGNMLMVKRPYWKLHLGWHRVVSSEFAQEESSFKYIEIVLYYEVVVTVSFFLTYIFPAEVWKTPSHFLVIWRNGCEVSQHPLQAKSWVVISIGCGCNGVCWVLNYSCLKLFMVYMNQQNNLQGYAYICIVWKAVLIFSHLILKNGCFKIDLIVKCRLLYKLVD